MVGMFGIASTRLALQRRQRQELARLDMLLDRRDDQEHGVEPVGEQIDDRLRRGVVRHRRHVDAGGLLEQLQRQVHLAAEALHAERDLAGIVLGEATNSSTVFTPRPGRTISSTGWNRPMATGRKSCAGSKSIFCGKCSATVIGEGDGEQQRVAVGLQPSPPSPRRCRGPAPGLFSMTSVWPMMLFDGGRGHARGIVHAGAGADRHDHADRAGWDSRPASWACGRRGQQARSAAPMQTFSQCLIRHLPSAKRCWAMLMRAMQWRHCHSSGHAPCSAP